ncbi:MAG: phosphoenolpyruvate hydrolase family protein [Boseongicola sp.]|nr:phosphoenolpyruvate hydrolase family protein [Boseongicola sp.]
MKNHSRQEILARLETETQANRPVLGAGTSCGLVAKCAALGGADLLIVYSTGRSRLMGLPTSRIGDSNAKTIEMAAEIRNVVSDTPVIGGVEAWDPTRMDLDQLLDDFQAAGFSGIINYPTISTMGETWRRRRGKVGLGWNREVELFERAVARDIFTMAYVATVQDALDVAEKGVDCLVPHVGATSGGLVGHESGARIDEEIRKISEVLDAVTAGGHSPIFLCHGGRVAEPTDTRRVYEETGCVGFVGASSIERIPIERAVKSIAEEFKSIPISECQSE